MFLDLVRFEMSYQMRQTLVRVATLGFFVFGFFLGFSLYGGPDVYSNAPFSIAYGMVLLSLSSFFGLALFTANTVLRDRTYGMEPLIHTTSVGFFPFLAGRLVGLVTIVALVSALAVVGMALGSLLPPMPGRELGPFRLAAYVIGYAAIALPNILIGLSVLFCIAALSRGQVAVYVGGIGLFMAYVFAGVITNSPMMAQSKPLSADDTSWAALLDPFAVFPLFDQVRFWDLTAKNTQLILLEGDLLANRLLWMTMALMLCCLAFRLFRFREGTVSGGAARGVTTPPIAGKAVGFGPVAPVKPHFGSGFAWQALRAKVGLEMRLMLRGVPLVVLSLLCLFMFAMVLSEEMGRGEMGVPLQARAALILVELQEPFRIIGPLVLIFFVCEWCWLARDHRIDAVIDSTAVPAAVLWAARWLGAACLIIYLVTLAVLVGLGYQLVRGAGLGDALLYLRLYSLVGLPLWFFAGWVIALQNFVPNKYLGMLAGGGLFIIGRGLRRVLDVSLPGLDLLYFPNIFYSEMSGGGYALGADAWLMLLHFGVACLVAVPTLLYFRRGAKRKAFGTNRAAAWLGATGAILTVTTLLMVFYQTQIEAPFLSPAEREVWAADYERQYRHLALLPQPAYQRGKVTVDLYPERRAGVVKGDYTFVNPGSEPLTEITLSAIPFCGTVPQVQVERAVRKSFDARFGVQTFVLDEPLAPGAEGHLSFTMKLQFSGYGSVDGEFYILPGASYLELSKYVPNFGYAGQLELGSNEARRRQGLPPKKAWLERAKLSARPWFAMELIASVPDDQRVLSLGRLTREWEVDGRRYSHFVQEQISDHWFALAAGRYAHQESEVDGVAVSVWYHPGHDANVATMAAAARDALTYYRARWGEYPYQQLRIVEIPGFSGRFGATSYATTIFAVESRAFLLDQSDPERFDMVYRLISHEVGHQWWGGLLDPAPAAGARLLTEGLCEYAEAAVFAQKYPWSQQQYLLDESCARYFYMRGYDAQTEPSLARMETQNHLAYFKGAHAMHLLTELLGRDQVDRRLAAFFEQYRFPAQPHADDLLAVLLDGLADPERARLEEVFREVVTYDLQLPLAVREAGADQVRVRLQTAVSRAGETDTDTPITLAWRALDADGKPLGAMQQVIVKPGREEMLWTVPREAAALEIDPRRLYLEPDRSDNRRLIAEP